MRHLSMASFGLRHVVIFDFGYAARVPYPNQKGGNVQVHETAFSFAGRNCARCSALRPLCIGTECTRVE